MVDNVKIIFSRFVAYEPSLNCMGTIETHQSTRSARIFFCCNFLAFSAFALLGSNIFKNTLFIEKQFYLDIESDASHTFQISTHLRSEKKVRSQYWRVLCLNQRCQSTSDLLLMARKLHICICICAGWESREKHGQETLNKRHNERTVRTHTLTFLWNS